MSVRLTEFRVPGTIDVGKWAEMFASIHVEETVSRPGIGICFSDSGEMYIRRVGVEERYDVPRCETNKVHVFYRDEENVSGCRSFSSSTEIMFTEAGKKTIGLFGGYLDIKEGIYIFKITDMGIAELYVSKPLIPFTLRDIAVAGIAIAAPTIVGAAVNKAKTGASIGMIAAGAYLGYIAFKKHR